MWATGELGQVLSPGALLAEVSGGHTGLCQAGLSEARRECVKGREGTTRLSS